MLSRTTTKSTLKSKVFTEKDKIRRQNYNEVHAEEEGVHGKDKIRRRAKLTMLQGKSPILIDIQVLVFQTKTEQC